MLHWLRKHKKSCIRGFAAVSAVFGVMCGVTAKVLAAEGDDNLISIGISAGDGSDVDFTAGRDSWYDKSFFNKQNYMTFGCEGAHGEERLPRHGYR